MLDDNEQEPVGFVDAIRNKAAIIVGILGLMAWMALLWLMFGDVL
ncbi:hypothetical protein [Rhizorhapis suberifaciens]|uniref:Uncharacterized protein n=1 Tax=Rhizorhapis suberifaciens TaxID=13656 RepID=A0A840HYI4_9SPHN|nr:hypothetical protein [Rhizorhapis suberifaciens]MBB4642629.1 hypothetical protein [Rhizorhapis suberifaciens]